MINPDFQVTGDKKQGFDSVELMEAFEATFGLLIWITIRVRYARTL